AKTIGEGRAFHRRPARVGSAAAMRIRFAARSDEDEWEALQALRRRIDAFWQSCDDELARRTSRFGAGERKLLERTLTESARQAAPGVHVELDRLEGGEHRVVVAPDGNVGGEPLADEFVRRAPGRPKRTAARFRPEVDARAAVTEVRARFGV